MKAFSIQEKLSNHDFKTYACVHVEEYGCDVIDARDTTVG